MVKKTVKSNSSSKTKERKVESVKQSEKKKVKEKEKEQKKSKLKAVKSETKKKADNTKKKQKKNVSEESKRLDVTPETKDTRKKVKKKKQTPTTGSTAKSKAKKKKDTETSKISKKKNEKSSKESAKRLIKKEGKKKENLKEEDVRKKGEAHGEDVLPEDEDIDLSLLEEATLRSLTSGKTLKETIKEKKKKKFEANIHKEESLSKNDTMKVYMQDIGQISLVSKEEEVELAAAIHSGNNKEHDEARATLIKANLRLVVKIAHDFKGLGLPLLDLISEGNIGLMRAVEKFDPAKGAKFSSYAAWWIKQSMRRALANQSRTIRIPVQSAGKINKIKSVRMKLAEKLGREPTDAEIASHLEFSERTVAGLKLADLRTFSLQDPIQQGDDGEFQDIIPDQSASTPDRVLGDVESVDRLMDLLFELDDRERLILKMRFGLDGSKARTLEEVSHEIGRTRERVRQIQNQALAKLRALLADEVEITDE